MAARISDRQWVPHPIITIGCISFCSGPAVCEPGIGVVLVAQDLSSGLVKFICGKAIFIEMPFCGLGFAIDQVGQIPGRAVIILDELIVGVGLEEAFPGNIEGEVVGVADLICVRNESCGGIAESLGAAVGV